MDTNTTYKNCNTILRPFVKSKMMGPIMYKSSIEKALSDDLLWTKEIDGKMVGFCLCRIKVRTQILVLEKIAINPEYQGSGFGKEMLLKAIGLAKERNLVLELSVVKDNKQAIQFYQHFGMKIVGEKEVGKSKIQLAIMRL